MNTNATYFTKSNIIGFLLVLIITLKIYNLKKIKMVCIIVGLNFLNNL